MKQTKLIPLYRAALLERASRFHVAPERIDIMGKMSDASLDQLIGLFATASGRATALREVVAAGGMDTNEATRLLCLNEADHG